MKLRAIAVAFIVTAFGAAAARAGTERSTGICAGLTMPAGAFSNLAAAGAHLGVTACEKLTPIVGVGVELNYHSFGRKVEGFSASGVGGTGGVSGAVNVQTSALEAAAHARAYLPVSVSTSRPYVLAGLGGYRMAYSVQATAASASTAVRASETRLGYDLGGGTTIATGPGSSVGIEAIYHLVPVSGASENFFTWAVHYNFSNAK